MGVRPLRRLARRWVPPRAPLRSSCVLRFLGYSEYSEYIHQGPAPKRMEKPPDPSKVTRVELAAHMAESVSSIGALAKFVGKAASSPALHSTVTAFAEYEGLIESTDRMLQKINQGLLDVEEVLDETSQAIVPAVSSDGLYAAAQPQQQQQPD